MAMRARRTVAIALFALASAVAAGAAESGLMSWFKNWKNVLERSAVEGRTRRMRTATSVAAVRGAPQALSDPFDPYWKGGWSEKRDKEREQERVELADAVVLILAGKGGPAREALDAFEKAHPDSTFLGDVSDARAKLDEMEGKPATPAAPVPVEVKKEPAPAAPSSSEAPAEAKKEPTPPADPPAEAEKEPTKEPAPEPAQPAPEPPPAADAPPAE